MGVALFLLLALLLVGLHVPSVCGGGGGMLHTGPHLAPPLPSCGSNSAACQHPTSQAAPANHALPSLLSTTPMACLPMHCRLPRQQRCCRRCGSARRGLAASTWVCLNMGTQTLMMMAASPPWLANLLAAGAAAGVESGRHPK